MTTHSSASSEMDPLLGGSSCNSKTNMSTHSSASTTEMDPLLGGSTRAPEQGLDIEGKVEIILKDPVSPLVYDEGFINGEKYVATHVPKTLNKEANRVVM